MSETRVTATLLISCRDQKGLVAAVSDFLYRNDGNIIHADQHTDLEEAIFLQRVEFEPKGFAISREKISAAFEPIAKRFDMDWSLHFSDYMPRVALPEPRARGPRLAHRPRGRVTLRVGAPSSSAITRSRS